MKALEVHLKPYLSGTFTFTNSFATKHLDCPIPEAHEGLTGQAEEMSLNFLGGTGTEELIQFLSSKRGV